MSKFEKNEMNKEEIVKTSTKLVFFQLKLKFLKTWNNKSVILPNFYKK
jgi:ribosomal protein S19